MSSLNWFSPPQIELSNNNLVLFNDLKLDFFQLNNSSIEVFEPIFSLINDDKIEDESGFLPIPYLKLTLGSFISMCFTHIPTVAIALYGLSYTIRRSKDMPKNICKAMQFSGGTYPS